MRPTRPFLAPLATILAPLAAILASLVLTEACRESDAPPPDSLSLDSLGAKATAAIAKITALDPRYEYTPEKLDSIDRLLARAVERSARDESTLLIVDKAAYRLFLVNAGKTAAEYPIELGRDPIRRKRMEGDCRTPEGDYRVARKLGRGETAYRLALLLDYPNAEDRRRFDSLITEGEIPSDASIGGAIEIHGNGSGLAGDGLGVNWTLGCVALSDEHIDELYPNTRRGDRVIVVPYSRFGRAKE
jgi:murein L,D-transpeptidase YafK